MNDIEIIYFTKKGCGPCNLLKPVMEKLKDTMTITRIDVEASPEMVTEFGVTAVPTMFYLRAGSVIHRSSGFKGREAILATISDLQQS